MQTRQQDSAITLTNLGTTATAGPWAFTVIKVVAGDEAATMVANTNNGNPTVPDGLIYVLASVHAKNTGSVAATINLADFAATGSDGVLRRPISMAVPNPALQGTVQAGAELEGWLPLAVNDATSATLWYDSVVLAGNWSNVVLSLVDGASLPDFTTAVYTTPDAIAGSDPAHPAGLNQAVKAGDWAVTVLRTASGQEIYNLSDYRLQALGQSDSSGTEVATWYGVYARITNLSAHPAVFSPNAMELADTTGEPWDNIMALTAPDPDLSREVMPGASREGWAAFQLRPYVTNFTVRIMPSAVADEPRYVSLDGSGSSGSSSSTTNGSSTPAASTDNTPLAIANGGSVTVNDSRVNLRKEPKTGSGIVAELAKGTVLTVTGEPVEADGYRWYPVTVVETGDSGYVVQDYITVAGN